jgi:hypothetical protein
MATSRWSAAVSCLVKTDLRIGGTTKKPTSVKTIKAAAVQIMTLFQRRVRKSR